MAQLIVRKLESKIVVALRRRAASEGVSVEEAHRRLLHDVLIGGGRRRVVTFKDHLAAMPNVGDDNLFDRRRSSVRRIRLT